MFKLMQSQVRQLDELLEAQFERRLADVLQRHFFEGPRHSAVANAGGMLPFARNCVERARSMGIVAHGEIARFGAWAAAYCLLSDEEREVFGTSIGALFVRAGTSGSTALALADYRLERMSASHGFAATLLARMKAVRESLT